MLILLFSYNNFIQHRDPILCAAFELSVRLPVRSEPVGAEGVEAVENGDFLWNAIWPKLPSGRPCYNPQGKWLRIFVERKMYTNVLMVLKLLMCIFENE